MILEVLQLAIMRHEVCAVLTAWNLRHLDAVGFDCALYPQLLCGSMFDFPCALSEQYAFAQRSISPQHFLHVLSELKTYGIPNGALPFLPPLFPFFLPFPLR